MPKKPTTTKAQIAKKIASSAAAARDTQDAFVNRDRVRAELQFLEDFPQEFFDLPCIEPRCKLCKAAATDRDLRRWLNRNLLAGTNHQEILDHLAEDGIVATPGNLSNHYRRHVLPYVMDTIRHKATTSVFVDAAMKLGADGSIAEIMVTSLLLKLQPIVEGLDPAELSQLPPDRQIELLLKTTKALADIQSLEAGAKLRAIEIALKQTSLTAAERKAMARAHSELREILKAHPALWAQLQPILAPLAGSAAASTVPALGAARE